MKIKLTGQPTQLQLGDLIVIFKEIFNLGIYFRVTRNGIPMIFNNPNQDDETVRFIRGDEVTLQNIVKDFCGLGM